MAWNEYMFCVAEPTAQNYYYQQALLVRCSPKPELLNRTTISGEVDDRDSDLPMKPDLVGIGWPFSTATSLFFPGWKCFSALFRSGSVRDS
jgi:hypothetical protein